MLRLLSNLHLPIGCAFVVTCIHISQEVLYYPCMWRMVIFVLNVLQFNWIKIRNYNSPFTKLAKIAALFICCVHCHNILSKYKIWTMRYLWEKQNYIMIKCNNCNYKAKELKYNFKLWVNSILTSNRVSPSFSLIFPLLYTNILPIYPPDISSKTPFDFVDSPDAVDALIFSFPLLLCLSKGRVVGNIKKIIFCCWLFSW